MSITGSFRMSADAFALQDTLAHVPNAVIEIERVVAAGDILTPYFWVSGCDRDAFEAAAEDDPSIKNLRQLDTHEETALYRTEWTDQTETIAFAYTDIDAVIVEATGQENEWGIRVRFDDHARLQEFRDHCHDNDIDFTVERLRDETDDRRGAQFGLTDKQTEALTTAWELGYFESPRRATLNDVADALGIAMQSASQRLRRAHQTMIGDTLEVTPLETDTD